MKIKGGILLIMIWAFSPLSWTQSCIPSTTPFLVRDTGVTETLGDIVLTFPNRPVIPEGAVLSVMLPTRITNEPPCPDIDGIRCAVQNNTFVIKFSRSVPVDQIRLRGIRADVSSAKSNRIEAVVELHSGPACGPISLLVAQAQPPLAFAAGAPLTFKQCRGGQGQFCVKAGELFPSAFTTIEQERLLSDSTPPDNGTQIRIVFNEVPRGVSLKAPLAVESQTLRLELIGDPVGRGPGDVDFVYEVRRADLSQVESAAICFAVDAQANQEPDGIGQSTVQAQLFPEPEAIVSFRHPLQNDPPDPAIEVVPCAEQ